MADLSNQGVILNVRDVYIAFLIKDSESGAEYEDPVKIPGTMQLQLAPRVATAALYGDGRVRHQVNRVDGYNITFDHNKIPAQIIMKMKGQHLDKETGVRRSAVTDQPKEFAMGWTAELTGEDVEVTWLPKCVSAPSNKNIQQATENINYSTDSLTVTSLALEYNNDFEYIGDTSDKASGFNKEKAEKFFKKVPVLPPRKADSTPDPDDTGA